MHDVNVVIVNYNMKDQVDSCLLSLFRDARNAGLKLHVTVVNNSPEDKIMDLLNRDYVNIKFVLNKENLGFAKAQNLGLQGVQAKYHLVLNPDTLFPEDQNIIRRLYDFMENNPQAGVVGPKIVYPDGQRQNSCYRFPRFWQPIYSRTKLGKIGRGKKTADYYFMRDFAHDETIPVDWIMGAAMFVRQAAIDQVGYFDERFWMYAEDSDWCRRMWEKGWLVYFLHDAAIQHTHTRGSAKTPGVVKSLLKNKLARTHLKSWLQYMWKWRKTHKYYA